MVLPRMRKENINFYRLFMQAKRGFTEAKKLLEAVMAQFKQCHEFEVYEFLEATTLPRTKKNFQLEAWSPPVEGSVRMPPIDLLTVGLVNFASPNPAVDDKRRDISRNLALRKDKEFMLRLSPLRFSYAQH